MSTSETRAVGRTGLKRDTAGFLHVVAQGLLSNGPLASSLLIIPTVAGFALGATPLAYLLGILVVWFWVNTPYQFGRRYAAASGVSHYVTRGIGTTMGYVAGLSYILYYTFFVAAIAAFIGGPLLEVTFSIVGVTIPGWTWIPLSLLALVPISGLVIYGLKPSLAYGIVTVFVEIIVLTAVSLIIIVRAGGHNSLAVYSHVPSVKGIAIGMLVAAFGMSGSTATVYLGEEAHLPFRTIRRALVWSTGLVVFVFLLVSYASTVGWGPGRMLSFSTASVPGLVLVGRYIGKWPEFVVAILTINSAVGEGVASTIIVSRLLHSFGNAGLMPSWLSRLVGRRRTPLIAVVMTIVAAFVLALAFGFWQGVIAGISLLLVVTTMAEFMGHFVGNVGLLGEAVGCRLRGAMAFYVLPVVSCISILAGMWATFYPIVTPVIFAPVIVLVLLLLGAAEWLLLRSLAPERARRVRERLLAQGEESVGEEVLIGEAREVVGDVHPLV